jgi:hypothetical protein
MRAAGKLVKSGVTDAFEFWQGEKVNERLFDNA